MKLYYFAAIAAASLMMAHANANTLNRALTIKAAIPATLDWKRADGSALHGTIEMTYKAATGLTLDPIITHIHSNHPSAEYHVSMLVDQLKLASTKGGPETIPLTVKFNDQALSKTPILLKGTDIFPNGIPVGQPVSNPLALEIIQAIPGAFPPGDYETTIDLVITHTL